MINANGSKDLLRRVALTLTVCAGTLLILTHSATARELSAMYKPIGQQAASGKEFTGVTPLEQRLMEEGLINVRTLDKSIMVHLKYARGDNFMGENVYGDFTQAYLQPEPARMLVKASQILQERHPNLRILVGDALRPRSIQHKMWDLVVGTPKQHYVANPYSGSNHNYGAAVDVTLYCIDKEKKLDMGTPFDHFGPLAQPRLESNFLQSGKLSEEQVSNRLILRDAMRDAGWHILPIEWWHFDAFSRDHIRRAYSIIE